MVLVDYGKTRVKRARDIFGKVVRFLEWEQLGGREHLYK